MSLYENVKILCDANHIRPAALERRLHLSNGYIGSLRKKNPSAINLQKIADYFHVSTDYLLSSDGSSGPVVVEAIHQASSADSSPVRLALYSALLSCTEEECQSLLSLLQTFRRTE